MELSQFLNTIWFTARGDAGLGSFDYLKLYTILG